MPKTNNTPPHVCDGCCPKSETEVDTMMVESSSTCKEKCCQVKSSNENYTATTEESSSSVAEEEGRRSSSSADDDDYAPPPHPRDTDPSLADESKGKNSVSSCRLGCCSSTKTSSPAIVENCCIGARSTSGNNDDSRDRTYARRMDEGTNERGPCRAARGGVSPNNNSASRTTESCCNVTMRLSTQFEVDDDAIERTLTCLAVIRQRDYAVDVFDIAGESKTFRVSSSRNKRRDASSESRRTLCFSTHGGAGGGDDGIIDGMITPCLDANGKHDAHPEEGCPCGVDGPHLHAHVYDTKVCGVIDDDDIAAGCAGGGAARAKAADWKFLSQLTLIPDDDIVGEGSSNFPITENMPKECNSRELNNQLAERGLTQSQWLHWRSGTKKYRNQCGVSCASRRLYPVKHEDHIDFLIHNETTGALYMEHPCLSCGKDDIHGRFRLTHTRTWMAGRSRINLHFFEEHVEPFRLLDVLSGLFELESNRVHAARAVVNEPSSRVGRSQFFAKEICCASEIPQVEAILRPSKGVLEISVNPTVRMVYVDHDVDIISASAIADALSNQGFGAVVKEDAATLLNQLVGIPTDVFVKSSFDMTDVFNNTNEVDRGEMSGVIQACLDLRFTEKQVKNVTVNDREGNLSLEHNPYYITAHGIVDMLDSHKYNVKIVSDGGADGLWALPSTENTEGTIQHQHSTVRCSVVLSGVFWIISMFSFIGGSWKYLEYFALLSVAFGLPHIALKSFKTLRRRRFDVNCMMFLAAVGALALQDYTESAAVTFLFAISEFLEQRATSRARNALSDIICRRPEYANVINPVTNDIVVLPANSVAVGTTVSVRTGDKIPCDGEVIEGTSTVDESSLTGESLPITKSTGMNVSGGTINSGNTQLVIRTTATSNNSAVARLIRLLEEAQSNRSETEKMVDSFAKVYTPIVVLTAFFMCTVPWAFGAETGRVWVHNGLVTIVIACPCALIISTPVTYVAGLAAVAQKGVVCKGGQHLEGLGRVKSIFFDKTGTLSQGIFALLHFEVVGGARSREEVFGYLALMEAPAAHPLSDAIVKGAANEQVDIPKLKTHNHTLLPGEGISATVLGANIHVGNKKLFSRLCLYDPLPERMKAMTDDWAQSGGTIGFISIEGEGIVGAYSVSDKIRDEAKEVVASLKAIGIDITMITGDQRRAAVAIGSQLGLEEHDIRSEMLPEDKLEEIRTKVQENAINKKWWTAKKAVMMVGDGVNDAPALALADVSVAMGEGAALAMDTADVTLMDSDLNKLLYIVRMGKKVSRTILENIAFSLVTKAIVMGFTVAGRVSLWLAIASDVGAMLIVTMNGMKLLPSSREAKKITRLSEV